MSLPLTYKMVATPRDELFVCNDGKQYKDAGGDWPPPHFR
jgi:hypothetical protein